MACRGKVGDKRAGGEAAAYCSATRARSRWTMQDGKDAASLEVSESMGSARSGIHTCNGVP